MAHLFWIYFNLWRVLNFPNFPNVPRGKSRKLPFFNENPLAPFASLLHFSVQIDILQVTEGEETDTEISNFHNPKPQLKPSAFLSLGLVKISQIPGDEKISRTNSQQAEIGPQKSWLHRKICDFCRIRLEFLCDFARSVPKDV